MLLGADHDAVALPFPKVAETEVGADAVVDGVTEPDQEFGPLPEALTPYTENVYAVPLVSPVTVSESLVIPVIGVCALVPMYGVTVKLAGAPPIPAGAVQLRLALVLPRVPVTLPRPVGGWY